MSDRPIGVRDEHKPRFGRQVLTIWSGPFSSEYEGRAIELPKHDGFMLTIVGLMSAKSVRVSCESPRTESNYERVDAAMQAAFRAS